ncbi:uncharacterized protein TRAVEDRAFT_73041, partial [Trametes versicolor FP-101664 SS1]|uniref:uncharacterized protein n=1 Tax=Trametes versicolor (strain FP-101664) TaxID=717944 RepID=UPI0004621B7D
MFACGYDTKRRNVVVKTVFKNSIEEDINLYLSRCEELFDQSKFACIIPPVAIVRSPYRFSFLVTPLWGTYHSIEDLNTIQGVLNFIRCTLTGLSFLHEHRIAHRDIHESNILADYYCYHEVNCDTRQQAIRDSSRSRPITYALFDFNLSLQLPLETSLKNCRRPASEAMLGVSVYHPDDVLQCEPFYNPFAYDVGCLGFLFINYLTNAIPTVPMLAALFGKMTTHVVSERFTAAEALYFIHRIETDTTPEILQSPITLEQNYLAMNDPSLYWSCTAPEFQSAWSSHRPPPFSLRIRLLRWLGSTVRSYKFLKLVRRILCI